MKHSSVIAILGTAGVTLAAAVAPGCSGDGDSGPVAVTQNSTMGPAGGGSSPTGVRPAPADSGPIMEYPTPANVVKGRKLLADLGTGKKKLATLNAEDRRLLNMMRYLAAREDA